jgi:LuxR family transcriptional regulator, maltose regulon positive regulatory protein
LIEPLDNTERLAVVIAPAGWGKTTLIADWARGAASPGRTAIGWLTLDEADDEPYRFWTYLICAMRAAHPALGGDALTALRVAEINPFDVAVPTLLNDLAVRTGRLTVILDDYHVVTDRVHAAVCPAQGRCRLQPTFWNVVSAHRRWSLRDDARSCC